MLAAQGLQIGASGGATRSPGHGVIDIGAVGDGVATGEPAQLVAGTYEGGKLGGGRYPVLRESVRLRVRVPATAARADSAAPRGHG